MGEKKKRQHYVWRAYLRAWASKESIWTYFKEQNKIAGVGLMGVGQERYFYKLVTFTEEEEKFLKTFIEHSCHYTVQPLCLDFLELFTSHYKLQKALDENTNSKVDREYIQKEIDKLEANLMEDVHGKFESHGQKLINCRDLEDFSFLNYPDHRNETIIFLCIQYFRTKRMKNAVLKRYEGTKELDRVEKFWNILSICLALTMATFVSINENLKFLILENKTEEKFIASDQPVFNLLSDKLDEKGNVIELELFYPITPQLALSIRFDEKQKERLVIVPIGLETIKYFNSKIFEHADYYIFADNESQLKLYLTA